MKIQMTKTVPGSLDGLTVQELKAGEQYDTVDSPRGLKLAQYHIKRGDAIEAPEPVVAPEPEFAREDAPSRKWRERK